MRFFLLKKGKILFSIPSMASKRKVESKMKMVIMAKLFQLPKFYAAIMKIIKSPTDLKFHKF